VDKTHAVKLRLSDARRDDVVPGTPAERIGLVWPLTREVVSLTRRYDAERRLQREITNLRCRQGEARKHRSGQTKDLTDEPGSLSDDESERPAD
jgi:hypothetical protein